MIDSKLSNKSKTYLVFLSIVQVIGAILVLMKHSVPDQIPNDCPTDLFLFLTEKMSIDHFALATFMLTSGALCSMSFERCHTPYFEYIKKRAFRLLTPYLAINTILFFPKALLNKYMQSKVELSIGYYFRMIITPRNGVSANLWFLPVLFMFSLISPFVFKAINKDKKYGYLILVASIGILFLPNVTNVFGVNDIKNYLFFYAFGMVFFNEIRICNRLNTFSLVFALIIGCGGVAGFFFVKATPYGRLLYLMSSVIIIYSISILLERYIFCNRIPFLTGKTFSIYIISFPVQTFVDIILRKFAINYHVAIAAMFITGILLPILVNEGVAWLKKKTNHSLPFVSAVIGA